MNDMKMDLLYTVIMVLAGADMCAAILALTGIGGCGR